MGGLTPIGAIGLGSSFLEYTNYIPTQARATFADVPGLEVHSLMLRLSTSNYPHDLPMASPWLPHGCVFTGVKILNSVSEPASEKLSKIGGAISS